MNVFRLEMGINFLAVGRVSFWSRPPVREFGTAWFCSYQKNRGKNLASLRRSLIWTGCVYLWQEKTGLGRSLWALGSGTCVFYPRMSEEWMQLPRVPGDFSLTCIKQHRSAFVLKGRVWPGLEQPCSDWASSRRGDGGLSTSWKLLIRGKSPR